MKFLYDAESLGFAWSVFHILSRSKNIYEKNLVLWETCFFLFSPSQLSFSYYHFLLWFLLQTDTNLSFWTVGFKYEW